MSEEVEGRIENAKNRGTKSLALPDKDIKVFPQSILELENLTVLDFSGNKSLKELPSKIDQLKQLQELYLSSTSVKCLPSSLSNICLSIVWLNQTGMASIPSVLFDCTTLKGLNLTGNKLSTLPDEIKKLKKLERLQLGKNKLNEIPKAISELKNLVELYLEDNPLTLLPNELALCDSLTTVHLQNNKLDPDLLENYENTSTLLTYLKTKMNITEDQVLKASVNSISATTAMQKELVELRKKCTEQAREIERLKSQSSWCSLI